MQAYRVERLCPREDDAKAQRGMILDWFTAPWRPGYTGRRLECIEGPPEPREAGRGRVWQGKDNDWSRWVMRGEYQYRQVRLSIVVQGD